MCGMPYHAAQSYIAKLIKAGRRVAICDQTSEPQPGKIVTREITQIITAGHGQRNRSARIEAGELSRRHLHQRRRFWLRLCGSEHGRIPADASRKIDNRCWMNWRESAPAEVLVSDEQKQQFADVTGVLAYDSYAFLPEQAIFTLCEHFGVKSLDGFGCAQMPQAVGAAGAIVHYLKHQLRRKIDHLTSLRCDAPAALCHARCRYAGQSRTGRIARRAGHELARRAGSNGHADGRAQIARRGFCNRCAI